MKKYFFNSEHTYLLKPTIIYILKLLFLTLFAVSILEVFLRLFHLGCKPAIPSQQKQGVPLLPSNANFCASILGHRKVQYITDSFGARVNQSRLQTQHFQKGILVVGDSQALGWRLSFEETFASKLAASLVGNPSKARILASPGMDPELALFAVKQHKKENPYKQEVVVLVLNLGNDLDEMYIGRQAIQTNTRQVSTWFAINSYLYMDLVLLVERIFRSEKKIPPGINPILYALNPDELIVLADQTADLLIDTVKELPPSDKVILLLIPQDYQVDSSQINKYRQYYKSELEFLTWKAQVSKFSKTMNAIEIYIYEKIKSKNIKVLRLSEFTKVTEKSFLESEYFDVNSHHLTPKAHDLTAQALIKMIIEEDKTKKYEK